MSDRLLRADERLLVGQHYKAWLPSPRIPQGQAFAEYLGGRQLELVDSRALNANAVTVVVRCLEEKTYRQAAAHFVGGLAEVTGWGISVDQVVLYQTDGPPGLVATALAPITEAADRLGRGAAVVGREATSTTQTIRETVLNFSEAAKWIAIGIPLAAAAGALVYVVATWRKK